MSDHWRGRGRGRGGGQPRGGHGSNSADSSRKICAQFKKHGNCKFGPVCRYSHNSIPRQPTERDLTKHGGALERDPEAEHIRANYISWRSLIRRPAYPSDLHMMKQIWEGALDILNGEDRDWQQSLPKDIQDDNYHGLQHIRQLLDKRATFHDRGIYIETIRSFLLVVTHSALVDCLSVDTYIATLYNFISGANGNKAVPFFQHLCEILVSTRTEATPTVGLDKIDSTFIALCTALMELLRREPRARYNEDLPDLIESLETAAQLMIERESALIASTVTKMAIDLRAVVSRASGLLSIEREVESEPLKGNVSSYPRDYTMPGHRHDNDKADISEIKIFPTRDEILSNAKEFLPSTDPDQPHYLPSKSERHVDTHFRLLRHDTFGKLKNELGGFLQEVVDDPNRLISSKVEFKDTRTHKYTNAFVSFLSLNNRGDFQARFTFQQPPAFRKRTTVDRRTWWEESRRLEEGVLLSYIWLRDSTVQHLFFVVARRSTETNDPHSLTGKNDTASITLKLANQDQSGVKALLHLSLGRTLGVLLEFPHVLPATFVPVLENLQNMQRLSQLPFREWILPDRVQNASATNVHIPPPLYARKAGFIFDLGTILKSTHERLSVNPSSSEDQRAVVDELTQKTELDRGQCEALLAALRQEFAFIQGPPGTGKSFLGIKLMKVILAAKMRAIIGPVVVVCFTNHALDQFLEHLLNTGIRKIVRVGGQGRSTLLEAHNLRSIAASESKSKHERRQTASAYENLGECEEKAKKILDRIHAVRNHVEWKYLKHHLYHHHGNICMQFNVTDEDGFTVAGPHPFDLWAAKASPRNDAAATSDTTTRFTASNPDLFTILEKARSNIHSLSSAERHALIQHWRKEVQDRAAEELFEVTDDAKNAQERLSNVHKEIDRAVLQNADVIGLTTSGLAKNIATLRHVQAKVVICEEAGEVLEAHIISALLPSVEHFIQIGDYQQLRPSINNFQDLSLESKQGVLYQLDRSQFERLCVGEQGRPAMPVAQLNVQRRMRPEISTLIRDTIYNKLVDHSSTLQLPNVVGIRKNVFWFDHDNQEAGKEVDTHLKRSQSNDWEVDFVHALVRHVVRQGVYKSSDIAVLTPYTGQLQKLRSSMRADFEIVLSERDEDALAKDGFSLTDSGDETRIAGQNNKRRPLGKKQLSDLLRIATVDNFQGEEAKIVIVSLVRSNQIRKVGFLKTTNRINVLLSRAQHGMYLIGNSDTYSNVPMWQRVIEMLRAKDSVGRALELCCPRHMDTIIQITQADEFARLSPEGGCQEACTERLPDCGHRCQARCHSKAMHEVFKCEQPCQRNHKPCDHPCQKSTCGEDCGLCMVNLNNVKLPCGHLKHKVACHLTQDLSKIMCNEVVDKIVPGCLHTVQAPCSEDVESDCFRCTYPCGVILQCGHPCPGTCGRCNKKDAQGNHVMEHAGCDKLCGRRFGACNHVCPRRCHSGTDCGLCTSKCEVACKHSRCTLPCHDACAPCIEPCPWHCEHQGVCTMPCAAPCNRLPCSKRCPKVLPCGHQCPGLCGEDCLPGYCKECNMKLDEHVDMIEFKEYKDIDLNETPVVALACGHFFTAETLDGTIGLSDVYNMEPKTGNIVSLKDINSELAPAIPKCPHCQRPIRQYATQRYNRLINRAVIDEMTKRFIVTGQTELAELEEKAGQLASEFEKSRTSLSQQTITGLKNRWKPSRRLRSAVIQFRQRVADQHKPANKLRDATMHAVQRHASVEDTMAALRLTEVGATGNGDHRIVFGTEMLVIKIDSLILEDQFQVLSALKAEHGESAIGQFPANVSPLTSTRKFLVSCQKFIADCTTKSLPRLAVEATLYYAQITQLFETSGSSDEKHREKSSEYHQNAQHYLEDAEKLCEHGFGNSDKLLIAVQESIKLLQREWYEEVTAAEIEAIKRAMVSGSGGIATHSGHWYNCVNGHPFAIGECGMPMELARCPDCGAQIGGQHHEAVRGVTRAQNMEN